MAFTEPEADQEFSEFLSIQPMQPPQHLSQRIRGVVESDLSPSWWRVVFQISILHLITGSASLALCSQFGMGLSGGLGLEHQFMAMGTSACSALCGAVFLGATGLASAFVFRPASLKFVRTYEWMVFVGLAVLSLAGFLIHGGAFSGSSPLAWVLGAIMSGVVSLELGWFARSRLLVIHPRGGC